jgi:urease accessory protein
MTAERALLTLLQFTDGLFPTGGFAHSFGLETYVQDGRVHDRQSLEAFVAAHLEGSAGPADAAAVAIAVRLSTRAAVDDWLALDQRLDAMKCVPEFRAASRQMGRQTLRVAVGLGDDLFLTRLTGAVDGDRACGHHASVFGAVVGRGGVAPGAAAAAYLYSTAELLVGAGLRLIALGQLEGQRVLAAMRERIERLAATAASATTAADLWSFNPAIEIAGIRHATLDSRLFRS